MLVPTNINSGTTHPTQALLREFQADFAIQGYRLVILAVMVMVLFAAMATVIGQVAFHGSDLGEGFRDPRQWSRIAIIVLGIGFLVWSAKHKDLAIRNYEAWAMWGWGLMGIAMGALIAWQYYLVLSGTTDEAPHSRYGSAVLMVTLAIYMSTQLSTPKVLFLLSFPSVAALAFAVRFLSTMEVSSYLAYMFICHILGMSYIRYRYRREFELFIKKRELNAALQLLEEAAARERKSSDGKTKVIASVSHDLRQPLSSLALYNNLLKRRVAEMSEENRGEFKEISARISECVGAMEGNLTRLQEIAQHQSKKVKVTLQDADLDEVVRRVIRVHEPFAQEVGVGLSFRTPKGPVIVNSNPERLFEIIGNLVSNAIKFSGGYRNTGARVLLAVRRTVSREGCDQIKLEVRDNGCGIPEADQARIFDEYVQIGNEERRSDQGYGLGLSIVREFCATLGHRIDVRSASGQGAIFTVYLGASAMAARSQPAVTGPVTAAAVFADASVLLVEDDASLRDALSQFLGEAGLRVRAYPSGRSVLAATANDHDRPACIISDFRLPSPYNGLDTVAKLREQFAHSIPALIISGDMEISESTVAAHDCSFAVKPVSPQALLNYISGVMAPATQASRRETSDGQA